MEIFKTKCSVIGGALDIGQRKSGTELGPRWLKESGLSKLLETKFDLISDRGELTCTTKEFPDLADSVERFRVLSQYCEQYKNLVLQDYEKEAFVLNLGGDHSLGVATLAAAIEYNPDVKIVWVDAHADINTPQTSPSGNMHGMPVALLLRLIKEEPIMSYFSWLPRLSPKNLVYIGLRDVDQGEKAFLKEFGLKHYDSLDVKKLGIKKVIEETLEYFGDEKSPLHLSFDVDGVDPCFFPSTGTPVKDGLTLDDGKEIVTSLSQTGRLLSLDLVELNPRLGGAADQKKTIESALDLLSVIDTPRQMIPPFFGEISSQISLN